MGAHKPGQVPIGAYVNIELRNYLDRLAEERGFLSRSDAVRAVLSEHMSIFSKRINRNPALTPSDAEANGNDCCRHLENDISLSKPQ